MDSAASGQSNVPMGSMQNNAALPYDFSIGSLLSEAWEKVKGMKAATWGAVLIFILASLAFSVVSMILSNFGDVGNFLSVVLEVVQLFVTYPIMVGLSYMGVRRSVNLPVEAKQSLGAYHFFWRIAGLILLQTIVVYGFAFMLALSFFVTPDPQTLSTAAIILIKIIQVIIALVTLYISFSFLFSYVLIVEKDFGIFRAYAASFLAYNQHWFKIIVAFFCMLFIYLVSMIPLGIGLIWTVPMLVNFMGILYRNAFGVEELKGVKTI